jgi:NodT family efflux transporter outer membrane factor (OMF) lipoprotein
MRTFSLLIVVLIASMFAAGCMVGPNYHSPKTKVSEKWAAENATVNKSVTKADQAPVAEWWTSFNDPTLNALIDHAVQGNLDLQIAQARVREARAQRGVVAADLYPTVNVSSSYQRSRISKNINGVQTSTGSQNNLNVTGDLYQVGFDASWEIDVFGGVRRDIEAANADISAQIEDRRNTLVTLLAEVARNYMELRRAQQQITIAEANLKAQQETLDITKVRFNAGLVSDLDVQRAQAQVDTTASEIPTLRATAQQSIHLLSVLLGEEPGALTAELSNQAPIPQTPPEIPVGLPSELLRRRPDVRRAERELAAQTARIGVATADLFPKFSLTGFLGLTSSKFSKLSNSGSTTWSILPGVSWPVLDFGRIRSNIAVENAREQQAAIFYEQTVLTSLREVADSMIAFSQEQTRHQNLESAVEANRRAVKLANELYKQGLADFLSVLQAQRDLFVSEDALVQSDSLVTSNLVALYKALGGGWEIESKAPDRLPAGKAGERVIDVTSK